MELSKDEFKIIVVGLKHYFPQENFLPNGQAASLWYERLKDIPYDILQAAVHMYVETNKFPPTIADLREKASRLSAQVQKEFPEPEEIIALIAKASENVNHNSEASFAKLPKIAQRLVGSIDNLRSYGLIDQTEVTQMLTNRIGKRYESMRKQAMEEYLYSPPIQELIAQVDEQVEKSKIEEKSDNGNERLLPGSTAREKFESLEDYKPETDNEFAQSLIARFGMKAPKKED